MKINLMTTCTSSGTTPALDVLNGKLLAPSKTHQEFAVRWKGLLTDQSKKAKGELIQADKLYAGQGFRMALRVKEALEDAGHEVSFHILSIGYGLIEPEQKILPYNLSLIYNKETGPSMYYLIQDENFHPNTWWRLICKHLKKSETPIADVHTEDALTLICTSNTFLSMVSEDAFEASKKGGNLYIMGLSSPGQLIKWTRKLYEGGHILVADRDAIDKVSPGNRYDFPQRVALHLIKSLDLINPTPEEVTEQIGKAFEEIKRGSSIQKVATDFGSIILGLKEQGKSMDEAFEHLQFAGTPIAYKVLETIWNPDKEVRKSVQSDALAALAEITVGAPEGDVESLELLQILNGALTSANKVGHSMTSSTIHSWAKSFCEKSEQDLPGKFKNPQRITHLMRRFGTLYGFIENPINQGLGIQFQFNPEASKLVEASDDA